MKNNSREHIARFHIVISMERNNRIYVKNKNRHIMYICSGLTKYFCLQAYFLSMLKNHMIEYDCVDYSKKRRLMIDMAGLALSPYVK